jgi:hypothetical protein
MKMADDAKLVRMLRQHAGNEPTRNYVTHICMEAADAITRLMRERRQARLDALEDAARLAEAAGHTWSGTRVVEQALQEAAVDDKCVEIAAEIRALATRQEHG